MTASQNPNPQLALIALPPPLYAALRHVFAQELKDVGLVGGTALAGYYAGHRRSDDLDLFCEHETAQMATVLAVQSLTQIGAEVRESYRSAQYFRSVCSYQGHSFTADVVTDPRIHQIGRFALAEDGVRVADVHTIFMMKAATLVSRASEKDLYDLLWLFEHVESLSLEALVEKGSLIDGGVNSESLIISLSGTILKESACDFALSPQVSASVVFQQVSKLRKDLLRALAAHARGEPPSSLQELAREARRLERRR